MKISPRAVIDTNILISALLFVASVPGQTLRKVTQDGLLLLSEPVLSEIATVLARRKFDRYVSAEIRRDFVADLAAVAEQVSIIHTVHICRDPKDNMILELAISGQADFILTGDQDLLALGSFHEVPIWTPARYLAQ